MAAPDFSSNTIETLMFRAGLICSRPECGALTIGPVDATGALKNKKGEAAHICAKKNGQARYDPGMTDDERAGISNGIWLCASCHTMIDKDKTGQEFPRAEVEAWKKEHEALIRRLYLSAKSPIPLLRRMTEDGKIAQRAVDCVEDHGAFVVAISQEAGPHVVLSVEAFRRKVESLTRKIQVDIDLKKLLREIAKMAREAMNETSVANNTWPQELMHLRLRCAKLFERLIDGWDCTPGPLCMQLMQDAQQGPGLLPGTQI